MLSIVLLTNGWGPKHGGINSFNTDLAKALGPLLHPGVRVACTVFEATDNEVRDAERSRVTLLPIGRPADGLGGVRKAEIMAAFLARWGSPVEDLWWIGHDVISGELAIDLAKQCGRSAVIHHMSYLAYQAYKQGTGAEAQKRHDQQKQVFRAADRVLAVGPLLRDSLADLLKRESRKIPMLVPGLAEIRPSPMPAVFSAITFGRLDPPNDRIKQGRLAVAAFADACRQVRENPALPRGLRQARMTLIGIARSGGEEEDAIDALSERYAAGVHTLVQLPYEDDREKLFEALSGSSVAMMLSWHEGFGLTGWEAIAAGVPLIVSRNSGLHQLIEERLGQAGVGCLKGLDIRGHYASEGEENFHPEDVKDVAQAILEIANQPDIAKKSARTLLDLLRRDGEYTWRTAARDVATALGLPIPIEASAAILDPPPSVPSVPGATTTRSTFVSHLQDWLRRYAMDLTQLAERLRAHPTWLDDPELVDVSVRERSIGEAGTGRLVRTFERALATAEPRIVLVGEGGAGKTTLLIGVAVAMASKALEHESAPLPLYLRLNFFDAKQRSFDGLLDALERSSGLPEQVLRAIWRDKRPCCFLLDGLNEVHPDFMDGCLSAIEQLAPTTGRHRCIVTSRLTADVDELVRRIAPATILETVPLTESQIWTVLRRRGLAAVADRLGQRLAELARTPFLLSAIVKICEKVDHDRVPLGVPQLIQILIDDYIFTQREPQKPKAVRPTTYHYNHVKRPILARVALQMVRKRVTRIPEDQALRGTIRAQLRELEAEFHGTLVVMPTEPNSTKFLDEVVLNDILRREGETLEFLNESVLDYYAGIGLSSLKTAEDIAVLVPPLVWRRIDVGYDELPIPAVFTEAIAMHLGLNDGAPQLLDLVAKRHPLVAARCIGAAGLHDTPAGRVLLQQWAVLLLDPRPLRRWVACQCLMRAGNIGEDAGQRLAELAHSDPEPFVRLVAMHALSSCARVAPIAGLIATLVAYDGTSSSDPGTNLWRLRSAQAVRVLVERWSAPATSDRDRARIESLLATMDPDFVDDVLARIEGSAAEATQRALPGWNHLGYYLGFQASRMIREQEKARAVAEEAERRHRERLSAETVEELQRLLKEGSEDERGIALALLHARAALTVDRIFDVLRDPSPRVRARAETALLELPSAQWCEPWEERMSDAAWTVLFHVPAELEEELFFELPDRWLREFASRGISARELGCVPAEPGWLLEPVSVGGSLEKDVYRVIHAGDRLAVIGASIRPRLAILGAHLGERAMPALDRFFTEDPRSARAAVIQAWGRIGTDAAIERLRSQVLREPLDWKVVEAIATSRHSDARMLLLDVLRATRAGMGVDVENRVRELTHILIDLGATEELRRLIRVMLDSSDAEQHVVAAHMLLAHGAEKEHPFEDLAIRACSDPDPQARVAGMKLLATTQDAAGREILLRACMNEPAREVWIAACAAFRRACSDEDLLRLRQARQAPNRDTRSRVIGALALVRDDSAIPDLHEALHDPDAEIHALAAEGLQKLGAPLPSTQRDPSHGDR
jgi:glycosyltransferase involved in cell wall biosynthesis/HEAT repeat protein